MKKILVVLVMVLMLVACGSKDTYGLGNYKDRNYVNKDFNLDFLIDDDFSFLNAEELKVHNDTQQENSSNKEAAKFHNKVMDISNVNKTAVVAYVDSSDDEKNAIQEANAYVDFLSEQGIKYKINEDEVNINGLDYVRYTLELDFDQTQMVLVTVSENKLINIQITYHKENHADAEKFIQMIDTNE